MDLQLCPEVLAGLKRLGNPALISEEVFGKVLELGLNNLTSSPGKFSYESEITSAKGDVVKEAYTAFLALMVEAARCNASPDQVNKMIANLSWPASRSNFLMKLYSKKVIDIQAALIRIGNHPPHIVDAHWQLNHCVKSSVSEQSSSPLVLVQLETEGEKCEQTVNFACSISELQDLQAKLKEALRHVDRIGYLSN